MARILIIDDEDALRRVLTRHFTRAGHTVTEIGDFREARDSIDARKYDVVFLDFCMPGMNGCDVSAALRLAHSPDGFELVNPPPIVMMTGHPDLLRANQNHGLADLALFCLTKPFSLTEADEVLDLFLPDEERVPFMMLNVPMKERSRVLC